MAQRAWKILQDGPPQPRALDPIEQEMKDLGIEFTDEDRKPKPSAKSEERCYVAVVRLHKRVNNEAGTD